MKNRLVIEAILLVVAFLAGFVPQYVTARQSRNDLRAARQEAARAELRDLAALAYVQANQKNYGLASATGAKFFGRARELADQTPDAAGKSALTDLLGLREQVTSELAAGNPAVMTDLDTLFTRTRRATGAPPER